MCGRYDLSTESDIPELREIFAALHRRFKGMPAFAALKTGEIFPTDTTPVLVQGTNTLSVTLMRWGFPRENSVIINARAETAAQKKLFQAALLHRRCIIPTTGFYEWRHVAGQPKEKALFRLEKSKLLYLAGLYSACSPKGKEPYIGYVILTTQANPSVACYHDRMPLIVPRNQLSRWLTDTDYALELTNAPCTAALYPQQT